MGDTPLPDPKCHPFYNGRDLPNGWAHIGEKDGYFIYAHFSNPDRPQWEHPDPPDDAPSHFLIDAKDINGQEILGRNYARDNFFRSSLATTPPADVRYLECALAEANVRIETLKYQYDQLNSTLEGLKVYLMIINSSIV